MDESNLPPRRRRIAGESPATPKSKAKPKPVAKKPVASKSTKSKATPETVQAPKAQSSKVPSSKAQSPKGKSSKVGQAVARQSAAATLTSEVETTEPVAKPTTAAPTAAKAPAARDRTVPAAIVAVVVAALGVGLFAWGLLSRSTDSFEEARESARGAAADAAVTILSYSYDDLEAHHEAAKSVMTDAYAQEYDENTAPSLDELAPQREVTVEAAVRNAGLVPCGDDCRADKATVLLFVDLDRRIAGGETAEIFGNRLVVDMTRSADGTWLVADVQGI